jgi:thioredoxin reductase
VTHSPPDRSAINGKIAAADEHAQILIIGAGDAGVAAAIEAADRKANVVLIDENPLDQGLFGLDVPHLFGGRMTGAVRHTGQMLEQYLTSKPALIEAIDKGVDVRLGVTAWGLFSNRSTLRALPQTMVGLSDAERSWMCSFDRLILTTGARDLALAFPGWDQPGLIGAKGLASLVKGYAAFSGHRMVILGSGHLAVSTAVLAAASGLEVAALVEVLSEPQAGAAQLQQLHTLNIPLLTQHTPKAAVGNIEGITHLTLRDEVAGVEVAIECDTVCLAVGAVPSIELLQAAGGQTVADSHRGGHVPVLNGWQSSIENVFCAGSCSGLLDDDAIAAEQGRQAARQALDQTATSGSAAAAGPDAWSYQKRWFTALTRDVSETLTVCQCEAVTRGDLLGVRAPRYLGPAAAKAQRRDIQTLLADGPVDQDQIKRLTRACMGVCQARRCREQVAFTLAEAASVDVSEIPLAGYRPPIRPLPLRLVADPHESPAMSANWEPWFDIRGQCASYADIGTEREFEGPFGGS